MESNKRYNGKEYFTSSSYYLIHLNAVYLKLFKLGCDHFSYLDIYFEATRKSGILCSD